ncbi:hypothetical protein J5N97_020350 [Dioscorea zingiberensis]|uniref:Uncharacterized protein n=1 Tax=Dioscorea zingiberensis TaxID=325984 RepID=A0A9D5HD55_9LILI|nr:hypothetical protein J5N97_020350 [Dioscorea zingiberensis]
MLKIQIKSKETIRPSSPTSPNLPPIQLSSLDHTSPPIYTHILLFYSTTTSTTTITNPLGRLKTSLSSTLTHFFPLAGRIQPSNSDGTLHVHCTDNGAEFIEALAEGDLESFLKTSSPIDEFPKLLPIKKDQFKLSEALLAVQVTMFDSGGHVLGLSMSHLIADGASMAMFLKEWSSISRGTASTGSLPKFDSSSKVFPPQPWSALPSSSVEKEEHEEGDQVSTVAIRRFVIDKDGVETLRSSGREGWRPTRVEAVSALTWRCLRRAKGDAWENSGAVSQVVNIRKKMAAALFEEDFGNLWVDVVVKGEDGRLEEGIREGVRGVDEEYVRRWIEVKEKRERRRSSSSSARSDWILTSWCRMGFYKSDFGWGEPAWVGCGLREMKDVCMFIDAKDGQGIELWVWLDADQMTKFETDPELLHFLSN